MPLPVSFLSATTVRSPDRIRSGARPGRAGAALGAVRYVDSQDAALPACVSARHRYLVQRWYFNELADVWLVERVAAIASRAHSDAEISRST